MKKFLQKLWSGIMYILSNIGWCIIWPGKYIYKKFKKRGKKMKQEEKKQNEKSWLKNSIDKTKEKLNNFWSGEEREQRIAEERIKKEELRQTVDGIKRFERDLAQHEKEEMFQNTYIQFSEREKEYIHKIIEKYQCDNMLEATILGVVLAPVYRMEEIIQERGVYIEQMKRGFAEVKYYVDKINNGLDRGNDTLNKMNKTAKEMNETAKEKTTKLYEMGDNLNNMNQMMKEISEMYHAQQNQSVDRPAESFQEMVGQRNPQFGPVQQVPAQRDPLGAEQGSFQKRVGRSNGLNIDGVD